MDTFKIGDEVNLGTHGKGKIEEIITLKDYDSPVACIRIFGTPGRFLRTLTWLNLHKKD
jgi:hypothetical protein